MIEQAKLRIRILQLWSRSELKAHHHNHKLLDLQIKSEKSETARADLGEP